ncbi:glycosyltransferase [Glycomyces buryatensis]|uniref:glycosyltransferase n=1 Tax=Glycomyces buryatensis TaxID=2570927 RepID=UPI0014562C1E|nr:glycosyltransferase [Glycomyces buryatensis]
MIHVNATAKGGGVAELLSHLVESQASAGLSVGWGVISGSSEFFDLTKRIHHLLHGSGDAGLLQDDDLASLYRTTLRPQAEWFADHLAAGDVVVLHDPQTLGLAPGLSSRGMRVVWHCHIGSKPDETTPHSAVWQFFEPYLKYVDTVLTSRAEFAPTQVPESRRHVVLPAIAPESPKNRDLSDSEVDSRLSGIGLLGHEYAESEAAVEQDGPIPESAPMVLQVSRWDPLKGMAEVLRSLERLPPEAHLVLAGPEPREITDDPEGLAVLSQVRRVREAMPDALRVRAHLVTMSMADPERNALLVNALQRRADVVTQKSLQEGFGLTVTEAMLKERAVVASDVGGIRAQIRHGRTGLLVPAEDDAAFADAVAGLLRKPARRRELGLAAAAGARANFLMPRLVHDYRRLVHPTLNLQETT